LITRPGAGGWCSGKSDGCWSGLLVTMFGDISRKMETRVYLRVPFERKEEVKELGGCWDQGAKLWWIREGVKTPFQVVEHDYIARREACAGACFAIPGQEKRGCGVCERPHLECSSYCFVEGTYGEGVNVCVKKNLGVYRGPFLRSEKFIEQCHASCVGYDTELSAGSGAREAELLSRSEGGKRKCLKCDQVLQPIGSERKGGRSVPDPVERMFHVACFKELMIEDDVFTALLVKEQRRKCRVCKCSIKSEPRVFIDRREIYHLKCYETLKASKTAA